MRFSSAFAGEFHKARSLPPLMLTMALSAFLMLAFCLLDSSSARATFVEDSAHFLPGADPAEIGLYGFASLALFPIIAAVLISSSEHSGGQITTSVLSAPHRGQLVLAKLVVSTTASASLGILMALMITISYQSRLAEFSVFATGEAGRHIIGLGLGIVYWVFLGLISTCAAIVFRSQTAILAVLVIVSFAGLPLMGIGKIFEYLPTNAGPTMFMGTDSAYAAIPPTIGPTGAAGVLLAWTAAAFLAAILVFARRDIGSRQLTIE
jgi:ABC-type transport system involved in multi-copper enzyme maturation permease subunit